MFFRWDTSYLKYLENFLDFLPFFISRNSVPSLSYKIGLFLLEKVEKIWKFWSSNKELRFRTLSIDVKSGFDFTLRKWLSNFHFAIFMAKSELTYFLNEVMMKTERTSLIIESAF